MRCALLNPANVLINLPDIYALQHQRNLCLRSMYVPPTYPAPTWERERTRAIERPDIPRPFSSPWDRPVRHSSVHRQMLIAAVVAGVGVGVPFLPAPDRTSPCPVLPCPALPCPAHTAATGTCVTHLTQSLHSCAVYTVGDTRLHTPWTDFQSSIGPHQQGCRPRTGRRWEDLDNSFPKTCRLVLESFSVRSN